MFSKQKPKSQIRETKDAATSQQAKTNLSEAEQSTNISITSIDDDKKAKKIENRRGYVRKYYRKKSATPEGRQQLQNKRERWDIKSAYAKQIIDEYDLIKVVDISEAEYLRNVNCKGFIKKTNKGLKDYRSVHQQIFVDKDDNVIEEDKYKEMSPQEREDKLRKTTKNILKKKRYESKKKAQKNSSQPVLRQPKNSNQPALQNTPTVSEDNHGQESEKKVYLKKISENGQIRYEKITQDEYLVYPDKDQIFELEEKQWDYLSPLFTDDPFTHNFAFFNNSNNSSQNGQALTSSSFTNNRPPARTPTNRK